MTPRQVFALGALVLVLLVWMAGRGKQAPENGSAPAPSEELQTLVAPVREALAGHPKADDLGRFYARFADTVRRDADHAKVIDSASDMREFNRRAMTLGWQGAWKPKVDGLAGKIDAVLLEYAGDDPEQLDRTKLADALDAIAWACRHAKR